MKTIIHALKCATALALLGAITSAHAFIILVDFNGDALHDELYEAIAGSTIRVGVYASQTPVETRVNGGLTGFGLYMHSRELSANGNSPDAILIDSQWDFVTQQSLVSSQGDVARVVGNSLSPGGNADEKVHLFDISLDVPATVGELYTIKFSDAENASFVSSRGFVYDDLTVFLNSEIKVLPIPDSDGDGLNDAEDNCILLPNPRQEDADRDGIGNRCDADLNQDCKVNAEDLGILKQRFYTTDPVADFNSSGTVSVDDLGIFRTLFFAYPGPSGRPNVCDGS